MGYVLLSVLLRLSVVLDAYSEYSHVVGSDLFLMLIGAWDVLNHWTIIYTTGLQNSWDSCRLRLLKIHEFNWNIWSWEQILLLPLSIITLHLTLKTITMITLSILFNRSEWGHTCTATHKSPVMNFKYKTGRIWFER